MILIVLVAGFAIVTPDVASAVLSAAQGWIVETLGWFYMLLVGAFVAFTLVICFTRYGKITLGADDEKPEFGLLSWFAMLFAAGMGIGLVFYGVGEPLIFATEDPKPGWPEEQSERGLLAMAQTFMHWGLHPWAIYAVIGLALAYVIHRRGRPVSIRWAFEPLLGQRVKGWMGDVIDVLAIFGTIFGIATSLGLGVQQIATGLQSMGIIDGFDNVFLVTLIVIITFVATFSVVSGLGQGIKWLSNINLSLAGLLLISVMLLGPTLFIFQNLVESVGVYLANFLNMTLEVGAYMGEENLEWAGSWTLFYWGWWMSWAPFVGIFIARISRGRTVRQFIIGVLLVPTVIGMIWFGVMGGTGIYRQFFGAGGRSRRRCDRRGGAFRRPRRPAAGRHLLGDRDRAGSDFLHNLIGLWFAGHRHAGLGRPPQSASLVACALCCAGGSPSDRSAACRRVRGTTECGADHGITV